MENVGRRLKQRRERSTSLECRRRLNIVSRFSQEVIIIYLPSIHISFIYICTHRPALCIAPGLIVHREKRAHLLQYPMLIIEAGLHSTTNPTVPSPCAPSPPPRCMAGGTVRPTKIFSLSEMTYADIRALYRSDGDNI